MDIARRERDRAYFAARYQRNREKMKANAVAWQKANREKVRKHRRDYNRRHPERNAARLAVARAIRAGILTRLPCEVCGNPDSESHHDDYSKQLDVRWLCPPHHAQADAARKALERAAAKGGPS